MWFIIMLNWLKIEEMLEVKSKIILYDMIICEYGV